MFDKNAKRSVQEAGASVGVDFMSIRSPIRANVWQKRQEAGVGFTTPTSWILWLWCWKRERTRWERSAVQRRPERPTRYQPRATPWVNDGVDCALTGQKHYDIYKTYALSDDCYFYYPKRQEVCASVGVDFMSIRSPVRANVWQKYVKEFDRPSTKQKNDTINDTVNVQVNIAKLTDRQFRIYEAKKMATNPQSSTLILSRHSRLRRKSHRAIPTKKAVKLAVMWH
jgi:hypothetical protein